ncbi:hypothetical protein SVEN_1026 [Streptomyces venezuelae ATCC 10712]|uniref:Uncharacterized protein n=1 Tax=Streptomyces venezuelae (strain ATCC 10712 / CBS 650.69 / DSM 40230 / JCM 4526 / NBRC 13096 / PD 04745) TaxID=953739 RepID=F2RBI5_STRVP|nr:hypothetical protein SVEN_1026 [Streptomyces venezuelae ATCC 10712]
MANLPSACRMIAHACDAYADHIDTALKRIPDEESPFFGEPLAIWERPQFGGEGTTAGCTSSSPATRASRAWGTSRQRSTARRPRSPCRSRTGAVFSPFRPCRPSSHR